MDRATQLAYAPAEVRVVQATQVKRVTTVVLETTVTGRTYKSAGASVCDQIDKPDAELGFRLAFGRALVDLGRQVKHEAWHDVQRHPDVIELPPAPPALDALRGRRARVKS